LKKNIWERIKERESFEKKNMGENKREGEF
jgi:hypothetical protein